MLDVLQESIAGELDNLLRLAPRLVLALLVLAAFIVAARLVAATTLRFAARRALPLTHRAFFGKVVSWSIIAVGIIFFLNLVGLKGFAASLVAGGGVTAIIAGFAFQGIGQNLFAGFFLAMSRSFKEGDIIQSGEFQGEVRDIEIRQTHIRAADGRDIFIPSYEIFRNPLVNFTRDGLRRLSFNIGIDYRDDTGEARRLLLETVQESNLVLADPPPGAVIASMEPNYVLLGVFFWIDALKQRGSLTKTPSLLMEMCIEVLLGAGFTLSSEVSTSITLSSSGSVDPRTLSGGSADS